MEEAVTPKQAVTILVSCINGHDFRGRIYLEKSQRLSDLMNDERAFLPLQQVSGTVVVIAKTSILWVNEEID
jgi:hypothetical protein